MRHPIITANFGLFNLLNTIAFSIIILCLIASIVKSLKHQDKKHCCKSAVLCKFLVLSAFVLLIVSTWVSLPKSL